MPAHDWTRVDAGTFHDFHASWITHLKESFNDGLLPEGYYAMSEQWAGGLIADVLTLQAPTGPTRRAPESAGGGLALAEVPPKVRRKLSLSPAAAARASRRTLTIRQVSGHRVVALLEIVSSANKDRPAHIAEFADKAEGAIRHGIHLLLVDLFPPGPHDPFGMQGAIWERFDDEQEAVCADEPLTMSSYLAEPRPVAYLEHLAVGSPMIEMPLFLDPDRYINVPLEPTYMAAYRGMPGYWRDKLES